MHHADIEIGQIYAAALDWHRWGNSTEKGRERWADVPVVLKIEALGIARRTDVPSRHRMVACSILDWVGDFDGVPKSGGWLSYHKDLPGYWLVRSHLVMGTWNDYQEATSQQVAFRNRAGDVVGSLQKALTGQVRFDGVSGEIVLKVGVDEAAKIAAKLHAG